jgi:hypothetical protein
MISETYFPERLISRIEFEQLLKKEEIVISENVGRMDFSAGDALLQGIHHYLYDKSSCVLSKEPTIMPGDSVARYHYEQFHASEKSYDYTFFLEKKKVVPNSFLGSNACIFVRIPYVLNYTQRRVIFQIYDSCPAGRGPKHEWSKDYTSVPDFQRDLDETIRSYSDE